MVARSISSEWIQQVDGQSDHLPPVNSLDSLYWTNSGFRENLEQFNLKLQFDTEETTEKGAMILFFDPHTRKRKRIFFLGVVERRWIWVSDEKEKKKKNSK